MNWITAKYAVTYLPSRHPELKELMVGLWWALVYLEHRNRQGCREANYWLLLVQEAMCGLATGQDWVEDGWRVLDKVRAMARQHSVKHLEPAAG